MEAIISSRTPLAGVPRSVIYNITPSLVLSWCLVSSRTMLFLYGIFFFKQSRFSKDSQNDSAEISI